MREALLPQLLCHLTMRRILQYQSVYYLITGLWPIVHFRSFRWVVGPKPDRFQLYTTTLLIVVIGTVLGLGARRRGPDAAIPTLGALSAGAFIGVELAYIDKIRKVFLLDMLAEALIAAAILLRWRRPIGEA